MSDSSVRDWVLIGGLILLVALAGCTTGSTDAGVPEATTSHPSADPGGDDTEFVSANDNVVVYEDNTAITKVEYDSMAKLIYWEDKTVCTRWESAQEGGVSCLPFNETQVDERYAKK